MVPTASRAGRAEPVTARCRPDQGFLGPDPPTRQVWSHPAAVLGFRRAVVLEHVDRAVTPLARLVMGVGTVPRVAQAVLRHTAPGTARIRAQHLRDERPYPARTTTPAAARASA